MSTTTTTPSPSPKRGMKKMVGWAILLLALLFTVLQVKACSKEDEAEEKAEKARERAVEQAQVANIAPVVTVEALVLEYECISRCSGSLPSKFRVETPDGDPVLVKWPGHSDWEKIPAKGEFRAPEKVRAGIDIEFDTVPGESPARVRVYQRVQVPAH